MDKLTSQLWDVKMVERTAQMLKEIKLLIGFSKDTEALRYCVFTTFQSLGLKLDERKRIY